MANIKLHIYSEAILFKINYSTHTHKKKKKKLRKCIQRKFIKSDNINSKILLFFNYLVLCYKGKNNEWMTEHKPNPSFLFTRNEWLHLDGKFIKMMPC